MGLLSSRRGVARVASLALAPPPCVRGEVYLTSPHLEPIGAARNSRVDPVPFLILPRFCSTSPLVVDHRSLRVSGAAAAQRGGQISPDLPRPPLPIFLPRCGRCSKWRREASTSLAALASGEWDCSMAPSGRPARPCYSVFTLRGSSLRPARRRPVRARAGSRSKRWGAGRSCSWGGGMLAACQIWRSDL